MKIRDVLVTGLAAVALLMNGPASVNARPADPGPSIAASAASVPSTVAGGTLGPARGRGVGGTGFRRVRDVLAEAAARRGPAAGAPDRDLAEVADDPAAFVDTDGRLLYIEQYDGPRTGAAVAPAPGSAAGSEPALAQGVSAPPPDPFSLNSRPGSTKTVFLDFDGYTVTGTAWNSETRIASQTVSPYDYDGVPGRSATDDLYIRAIWQAVAEDYAAFDVNVTTQQPPDAALYRSSAGDNTYGAVAVITPDKWMPTVCGSGCGGIAYVGIFGQYLNAFNTATPADRYYAPAWIFAASGSSWTAVADTISHEVGHNLGLDHDGLSGANGCVSAPYFSGNGSGVGSWGPIMGAPYGQQYTQWSKGEYTCANQFQDDTAIIASKTGVVTDESSSFANAVQLPTTELPTADQVIGFAGDVDYFSVAVNGYLKVTLRRSINGTSLYPRYAIVNSSGTEFASGFLTSANSGSLELTSLPAGTYYVTVTGSGLGTPQTAFSNYGSLGYYNVSAQLRTPNAPGSVSLQATDNQRLTAAWSASTTLTSAPITYAVSLCDVSTNGCQAPIDTTSTSLLLTPPTPSGSYYVQVNARHIPGGTSGKATSVGVDVLTAPIAPSPVRLVFDSAAQNVTVTWAGGQEFAPVTVTGRTLTVVNRSTGLPILSQSIPATGSFTFPTSLTNVWLDATIVAQTGYPSPWSSSAPSPVGSVFLGRPAAPQAAATTPAPAPVPAPATRSNAPQTAGVTGPGRLGAPQA